MPVSTLLVNPGANVGDGLDAAFGEAVSLTRYSRPIDDTHPRMRGDRKRFFDIVVFDLQDWAAGKDAVTLLQQSMPQWLREAFLESASSACVCVITPTPDVYPAVIKLIKGAGVRETPYVANFGGKPSADVAAFVHSCWSTWKKPGGKPGDFGF